MLTHHHVSAKGLSGRFAAWMTLLSLLALLTFSCKKEPAALDPDTGGGPAKPNPGSQTGKVCPVGVPQGEPVSAIIGVAGGKLVSADKRLRIDVPADAFSSDQTLSIQPIANTNPGGKGVGYRIEPHKVSFAKPILLTFTYEPGELEGTLAEALQIAYQNNEGVWMAMTGTKVDTVARTVSVLTTHFSDWSFMHAFDLIPASAVVEPGKSLDLHVQGFFSDALVIPLTRELPVIEPVNLDQAVEQWNLGGAGSLKGQGSKATYVAPGEIPARNPVAVSVAMAYKGRKFSLVTNVYVGREGVAIRFANGAWLYGRSAEGVVNAGPFLQLLGSMYIDNKFQGQVTLQWAGQGSGRFHNWGEGMPRFTYSTGKPGDKEYYQFYGKGVSGGGINIIRDGKVGEYVMGTFYLDNATVYQFTGPFEDPFKGTTRIDGFFMVKRTR